MQPDLIGGRYRVQEAIGQGGMGTVWLARDETLNRDVAVKQVGLLPGESATDSARAMREARSSAALGHRNVVTVFDVVEEHGSIWLVMERVLGRSLADLIDAEGSLDPARVARIGAQVADGLAAAHAAGTIHRDVKPGNVLVGDDDVAKISDFGIARQTGDPTLTQSGFLTGTPSYFSPELARGAEPGPATDVWALGATLYYAVEGRPPYEQRSNPVAVLHDITSGRPPRPQRADFLDPALQRMLDPDPESRWTMRDAAHALRRLADGHRERTRPLAAPGAVTATRVDTPAPSAPAVEAAPRERRRRGAWAALVALLLLAVVGVAAYALTRDDKGADGSARSSSTGTTKDTPSQTPSHSTKPSPSPSPSRSSSPSKSPSSSPSGTGAAGSGTSAADQEAFLRDYFAKAPGGTDAAWAMLGPGEKAQGRDSYDRFWRTIRSVDVSQVDTTDGGSNPVATLSYHTTDGRDSTERKRIELIRQDGQYLINSDVPAG